MRGSPRFSRAQTTYFVCINLLPALPCVALLHCYILISIWLATSTMAAAEASISSFVVIQHETLIRITVCPWYVAAAAQHLPSFCTAAATAAVRAFEPKLTNAWLKMTGCRSTAVHRLLSQRSVAKCAAWLQHPSTNPATPSTPSCCSAAHATTPRARFEFCNPKGL